MITNSRASTHERIDHQRKFRPLQRLAESGQHQRPAGADDGEIPQAENPVSQPDAGNRPSRKQRNRVVKEREKCIAEPAQHDSLRVVVPQTTPTKPGPVSGNEIGGEQFDRRGHAERNGNHQQRDEGG